jgi:hypothetical protein
MSRIAYCDFCGERIVARVFATKSEKGFSFLEIDEEAEFCSQACKDALAEQDD